MAGNTANLVAACVQLSHGFESEDQHRSFAHLHDECRQTVRKRPDLVRADYGAGSVPGR